MGSKLEVQRFLYNVSVIGEMIGYSLGYSNYYIDGTK